MKIGFSKENAGTAAALSQTRGAYVLVLSTARLVAVLAALCGIAAAGIAGYWFAAGPQAVERLLSSDPEPDRSQAAIELPNTIANLHPGSPSRLMQIGVTLIVAGPDRDRVTALQPQLVNALQDFLRNLDQDDLQGSAGLHRLRVELRRRFNFIAGQDAVIDVLLRNLLTQ